MTSERIFLSMFLIGFLPIKRLPTQGFFTVKGILGFLASPQKPFLVFRGTKRAKIFKMEISKTILTNMCMLYKGDGSFLVQNRLKQDWPGLNFPGGHVERYESIEDSVRREMKEETGLSVGRLEQVGIFEWNVPKDNLRHLAILYRSDDFSGELNSSPEGPVFFVQEKDLAHYPLSTDFLDLVKILRKGL